MEYIFFMEYSKQRSVMMNLTFNCELCKIITRIYIFKNNRKIRILYFKKAEF